MGCRMPLGPRKARSGSTGTNARGAASTVERSISSLCALAFTRASGLCSACAQGQQQVMRGGEGRNRMQRDQPQSPCAVSERRSSRARPVATGNAPAPGERVTS
jgi:hypothetical protein